MPSERIQRRIDGLLNEAEEAVRELGWDVVRARAKAVLALDPDNLDAINYLAAADRAQENEEGVKESGKMTGRKQSEVELRPEYEGLRWLVDTSPVGVFVVDASTRRVLLANREVQRILGFPHQPEHSWEWYERAYERRRPDGSLYASEDLPLVRALEKGETVRAEEMWLEFPEGRKVRVLASATPVYSDDGRIIAAVVISQDITPLEEAVLPHSSAVAEKAIPQLVVLPRAQGAPITLEFAFATQRGLKREANEDWVYCEPADSGRIREKGWICALADGMGGHAGGEVASQLAVRALIDAYYASLGGAEGLRDGAIQANAAVYAASQQTPAYRGMGTTLTAAAIAGDGMTVVHVGDSRAYLLREGVLRQITHDHTLVGELVRTGALTPDQARVNPYRNILTRAVGREPSVEAELVHHQLAEGDRVLLCSDGVYKTVTEAHIAQVLESQAPRQAADALITITKQRGGDDDMSVIVVACGKGSLTGLEVRDL